MVIPANNLPPQSQQWARELERQVRDMRAQLDRLTTGGVMQQLNATVSALGREAAAVSSVHAIEKVGASFNSGAIPGDSVTRFLAPQAALHVTVPIPSGRALVMVSCSEAVLSAGSGAVTATATFQATNTAAVSQPTVAVAGAHTGRLHVSGSSVVVGGNLVCVALLDVLPGTYTIAGIFGMWATGSGASIQFNTPKVTVQVLL